ncbi:PAS domain-containing sensor histidine kinase [Palleronia rufa]|uniref:PAS domain-containing sensor histidine kinase n=1 Tax=Palleronia rufa TaxID=1530186 RepID=UPI00056A5507|nr:PAS domain-containing sensor histidine kinase [Palleronia rufa]
MRKGMYQELFFRSPTPCLVVDRDGRVVEANAACARLFGMTPEKGSRLSDLLEDRGDRLATDLARAAGSDGQMPSAGTLATGSLAGLRIRLSMRGMRLPDRDAPLVTIHLRENEPGAFRAHTDLIRRLNGELRRQRALQDRLETALEREKYLHGELIHRIKNNLALLSSLIRVRGRRHEDPEVRRVLEEVDLRTRSIALVHDLLDRNQTLSVVNSEELITELCALMSRSLVPDSVELHCDVEALELHNEDATALCLLINELVTNALKHAFVDGRKGRIDLDFRRNGVEKMELHIRDDGRGMQGDAPPMAQDGHGTGILHALAEQLRGELIADVDEGTAWRLIFHPRAPQDMAAE